MHHTMRGGTRSEDEAHNDNSLDFAKSTILLVIFVFVISVLFTKSSMWWL